ncbi:putative TMEM14 family protein [Helianthus annuus]|uniref:Putative TMEM14 family n=1 Tax=Helianthus annuus TaxID=4232 RepID=A0A251RPY1_HELAN|nr:protein FATTY ACID EXPORT 4, chloroplastic [Helianthus annuus]KAF5753398.1 putative TMEM14 family protein [Helianthus annuus]KAJ0445771.1 putative TMEM14 family protein [Helianthus annuus]KAJ0824237.1 putative TMEM14 family protein [Helianthus annuus]
MGALPAVYTLGFSPNRFTNTATAVRTSSVTVSPTAGLKSTFVVSSNVRQKLRKLPSSRLNTSHVCKCQLIQDFAPIASAGYAVLLLGGGLFAYNKSGSKGSLFGGLTGATLMSVAYYLMQASDTKELGDALAFGASLLFAFVFGIRFAATRKVVPAGLLLVISIGLTALTLSAYLQDKV